jgi:hypothetical protein
VATLLINRQGSHDFKQVSPMQAKRFGCRGAIPLRAGQCRNDELTAVAIDGVVVR